MSAALTPMRPKRARAGRLPLPESCNCGKNLVKVGEDINEQLDVEPARFLVRRHIRSQCACRGCETASGAAIAGARALTHQNIYLC